MRFFIGLNEHFGVIKSQILLMNPLPTPTKVFSMVLQHERQCTVLEDSQVSVNYVEGKRNFGYFGTGKNNGVCRNEIVRFSLSPVVVCGLDWLNLCDGILLT